MTCYGLRITDDPLGFVSGAEPRWRSTSTGNASQWKNPAVDAALDALYAARDDAARRAALETIAKEYVKDLPFVNYVSGRELVAWKPYVVGVYPSISTQVFLDKAWLNR
jgi:ABC-type transport system substrate-binding protein